MARGQEFKATPEARVKQPAGGLFDDEPAVTEQEQREIVGEAKAPASDWLDIPALTDARERPYNGEPIVLTPDGEAEIPAVWRKARRYDGRAGKWVEDEFFAHRNAGGQRIEFEPIGYRRLYE